MTAPDAPDRPGSTLPVGPTASSSKSVGQPETDHADRMLGRLLAGRYLLERVIGRGGMGIVYAARHVRVGRSVAVKVLRPDLVRVNEATARFLREARAAAAVGNEHIVDILDQGYGDDGEAFIVMELLVGEDLRRLITRDGALAPERAVGIARQTAEALQSAHDKGVIHRDLKSENIFITARDGADFVKVVDFGISKVLEIDGQGPITESGALLGTPHYMAPEQGEGKVDPDHRVDVYALGCILFEMLTGELPFTGRTSVEVMYKHVHEAPRTPSRVRPDGGISPALDAVVLRALAKNRDKRFPSTLALANALPEPGTQPGGSFAQKGRLALQPPRRWRKRALAAGLIATFGLGLAVVSRRGPVSTSGQGGVHRLSTHPPMGIPATGPPGLLVHESFADSGLSTPATPSQSQVVVTLVVRPDVAVLSVDGRTVGTGDFTQRFALGSTHWVSARAQGYAAKEEWVTPERDLALRWTLTHLAPSHTPTFAPQNQTLDRNQAVDAASSVPTNPQPSHGGLSQMPGLFQWDGQRPDAG